MKEGGCQPQGLKKIYQPCVVINIFVPPWVIHIVGCWLYELVSYPPYLQLIVA